MTRTQKNNVTQSKPRKVGPHANFPHCKRSEADEFILVMPVTWAEHGQVRSVLIVTFITNFLFFFLNSKLFTFLINEARRSCEHRRRMQINFFEKIVEFRLKNYRKIGQIFWEQIRWKCKRIDVNRNRIKGNDRAICQRATGESRNERARARVLSAYRRPFFIGRRIKNRPTPNDTTLLLLLRLLLPLSASLCWLSFWKMRRQSVADANYSRLFFFFLFTYDFVRDSRVTGIPPRSKSISCSIWSHL